MAITQWYDIVGVIGAIFAGFSAMLVLVVHLEQWLTRPGPDTVTSTDEQALHETERSGIEHWAPDLSIEAGAPYLPRAKTPGLGLDPPASHLSEQVFRVSPPNFGQQ